MKVLVIFLLAVVAMSGTECNNGNGAVNDVPEGNGTSSRILSRRKRFLLFPDGSSFQLVFCCQTAALIPIGDIFLFGNTAALAWSLPTDPDTLLMFKNHEKLPMRRGDNLNVYYVDEAGKLVAKVPYKRPAIVNPAFAKRSIESPLTYKERLKMDIDRTKMHNVHLKKHFLYQELDSNSAEFHRSSRVGLLEKIEGLITALGGDGRQCVLRKLCESGKIARTQGTFLQELLRVVFTLPKGKEFEVEDHKEYDRASLRSNDCATLYPRCGDSDIPAQL